MSNLNGNILSVQAAGEGQTLFLLHGFPLDHRMWQYQIDGLSDRMHVVAVQMRGFGSSTLSGLRQGIGHERVNEIGTGGVRGGAGG